MKKQISQFVATAMLLCCICTPAVFAEDVSGTTDDQTSTTVAEEVQQELGRDDTEFTSSLEDISTSETAIPEDPATLADDETVLTDNTLLDTATLSDAVQTSEAAVSDLESVLARAEQNGFCYTYWGDARTFDGTRTVSGSAQDIQRLKSSNKGTLLVRYKTSNAADQVLFAAGKDYSANNYGALLANNVSSVALQRVDFPTGMVANLNDTTITNDWNTFVYSVDAADLKITTGKTVTSFNGTTSTQYPDYAAWFNANENINDIQYLTIGGAANTLANSNNSTNFVGEIAFVAFVPETFTQEQAAQLSASSWPVAMYSQQDITIASAADAPALDAGTLSKLLTLDEMSIVVKYNNSGNGIGSLFSVSDPTKTNSHFHFYQYGNTIGFEFRNNDTPKYASTCGYVTSGADNTIAFKAEPGVGYKLFANGVLGSTLAEDEASYKFLSDLSGQTAGYIGKTQRSNDANSYLFNGRISNIEIYDTALPDSYLIERTAETEVIDNRVFFNGDNTGSKFFRIPFLLATADGTLIAGNDANFGSTGDSAENIDVAIRTKNNAADHSYMEGWNTPSVPSALHMQDYTDTTGYRQDSASYIDGVILEDTVNTNRTLLIIDAFAWNGGVFSYLNIDSAGQAHGGTNRDVAYGDGFCTIGNQKYLLLSSQNITGSDKHGTNNINNNITRGKFDYIADIYGPKNADGRYNIYKLKGQPKEYSASGTTVDDSNLKKDALSAYSLSTEYELYKNGVCLTVKQRSDDTTYTQAKVPMKVFYKDSELQLYNTSYLMQFYSTDNGATWNTDKIITGMVKPENSRYFITGPGNGIQLKNGTHKGRIIVPIYSQRTGVSGIGNPCTSVIYSDDGGVSWKSGDPIPSELGLHESAVVEMPNGSLKIFVRNTSGGGGKYITATSNDGGDTWVDAASVFGDSNAGINSQISAIGISQLVPDPDDTAHSYPALIMTTANNKSRTNGHMWVGLIKESDTYKDGTTKYSIDWAYDYQVNGSSELFAYSCMAQLANGKIGLLYETSPDSSWSTGLQGMYYKEYDLDTILGLE